MWCFDSCSPLLVICYLYIISTRMLVSSGWWFSTQYSTPLVELNTNCPRIPEKLFQTASCDLYPLLLGGAGSNLGRWIVGVLIIRNCAEDPAVGPVFQAPPRPPPHVIWDLPESLKGGHGAPEEFLSVGFLNLGALTFPGPSHMWILRG